MSTTESIQRAPSVSKPGEFEYRALSTRAIASLVLGLISLLVFAAGAQSLQSAIAFSPIPLIGVILSMTALSQMKKCPGQYSGKPLAVGGLALGLVSLLGGLGFAGYVFATEVPPDHQRVTFADLRPDEVDERANRPVPKDVAELDGKLVFIKGYMRPDSTPVRTNVKRFLLVRDNNQCCFGDLSSVKFFDQMLVDVGDDVRLDKSLKLLRIAGTLHVDAAAAAAGQQLVFRLDANYAQ